MPGVWGFPSASPLDACRGHMGHNLSCSVLWHTSLPGCPWAMWSTTASRIGPESLGSPVAGSERTKPFSPLGLLLVSLGVFTLFGHIAIHLGASLVAQMVKKLPAMQETWVRSLGGEDPLEKGMATHCYIPAWRIPWTEEPGGPQSMGHRHN